MTNRYYTFIGSILFALFISGCASIPPEAPELSVELGKRISAIEESNVTLLHRYFDHKRKDIDSFIQDEWIPEFANQFFSNSKISKMWDDVVSSGNKYDRHQFILRMSPKLQAEINNKRIELITPVDEIERTIENKIRTEYTQARAINNSITGFLFSASELSENRSRYMEMLGVNEQEISRIIDKTDNTISDFLEKSKKADEKLADVDKYLKKLRKIRESI